MSLKAIASVLGLSVTTVSRALNGYEDVAKQTRQRVEEEAQRRGYRPNVAARRLKTGRANAVGLVYPMSAPPLSDTHFNKILVALDQRLSHYDIDLLLLTDKPHDGQRSLIRMLRSRAVDAIVVTHTSPHDERLLSLQQKGFNFLTLGRSDAQQDHAWFDVDNAAGSVLAVKHCLALGMQRIAWLGGNETCTFVRDRRQGSQLLKVCNRVKVSVLKVIVHAAIELERPIEWRVAAAYHFPKVMYDVAGSQDQDALVAKGPQLL
jgi:LacI family transcriptional regulator